MTLHIHSVPCSRCGATIYMPMPDEYLPENDVMCTECMKKTQLNKMLVSRLYISRSTDRSPSNTRIFVGWNDDPFTYSPRLRKVEEEE